jgi:hypothetical protein
MRRLPLALLVTSLSALIACGSSRKEQKEQPPANYPASPNLNAERWTNGLNKAAKELGCTVPEVAYQSLGEDRFVFRGAGKEVEYDLFCRGWSCVWLDDPRVRASFDLNCPREQMQITYIDPTTRGVAGCEHRATYVVRVTGAYEVSWVQNSASQP